MIIIQRVHCIIVKPQISANFYYHPPNLWGIYIYCMENIRNPMKGARPKEDEGLGIH